jgi:hypothetical protein
MKRREQEEELDHNLELIKLYRRSLRVLELQAAKFGSFIPTYIQLQIDEI